MAQLADTKHQVDILLRRIICESVNQATVAIVAGKPNDQDFFTQHCVVVDTRLTPETRNSARALSASSCRNVAIVDRTVSQADLALAASEIVRARFSFDGKSPYAPDLVLVNEFVLQQFCREAANFATISLVGNVPSTFEDEETDVAPREPKLGKDAFLETLQKTTGVSTLVSGTRGTILLVQQRYV
jgi:fructose-specific component phosphotransferase system IIB-like protein